MPSRPILVTWRVVRLPSLRGRQCFPVVRDAILSGAERPGFRVIEFSVQRDHLLLLCEADDHRALAQGMQGLGVRIARRLNRRLGRRGRVFADRFQHRALATPSEVRDALCFVLNNARRHARKGGQSLLRRWIDPCSSGAQFNGWSDADGLAGEPRRLPRAKTWLGASGWRRIGPISVETIPDRP